jgi:hypothetical protein
MIIVGFRILATRLGTGRFLCPGCRGMQAYQRQRIAPYFTLYGFRMPAV